MHHTSFWDEELEEAWVEGDETARWRSGTAHGPSTGATSSGSSLLEVEPGCRLPRHTDSAEETIAVMEGIAGVRLGDDELVDVPPGGIAVIPADVPHEVRSVGKTTLRFVAVYAGTDVVTRYEDEIQPGGDRERVPVA